MGEEDEVPIQAELLQSNKENDMYAGFCRCFGRDADEHTGPGCGGSRPDKGEYFSWMSGRGSGVFAVSCGRLQRYRWFCTDRKISELAGMGAVLIKAKQSPERIASRKIFAQIVKIGFPSALETALYNIAMTFIVRFMNQMDVDGMNVTARSYAVQIANFSYCVGAALAQANAIMTGWRIGAKEFEECNRGTRKAAIYGIITATCFSVTFALAGHFIVHIFTDDTQMINLVVKLLIVDVFLEFGRVTNLVYGQALKTSGDALFPVILGAIFMYLFAVGGTYFLGIHMGLLAVGSYIAMAGDECARAVGMVLRWKSGKWKSKGLIEV